MGYLPSLKINKTCQPASVDSLIRNAGRWVAIALRIDAGSSRGGIGGGVLLLNPGRDMVTARRAMYLQSILEPTECGAHPAFRGSQGGPRRLQPEGAGRDWHGKKN